MSQSWVTFIQVYGISFKEPAPAMHCLQITAVTAIHTAFRTHRVVLSFCLNQTSLSDKRLQQMF